MLKKKEREKYMYFIGIIHKICHISQTIRSFKRLKRKKKCKGNCLEKTIVRI